MAHVKYNACDGCQRRMTDDEVGTSIRMAIWNPEKQAPDRVGTLEMLLGRVTYSKPVGDYDTFEFCSAACVLLAVKAQALLDLAETP